MRNIALDDGELASVAEIVGWSVDKLRTVLTETVDDLKALSTEEVRQRTEEMAEAIAAMENRRMRLGRQASAEKDSIEQLLIDSTSALVQHAYYERDQSQSEPLRMTLPPDMMPLSFASILVKFSRDVPSLGADILRRVDPGNSAAAIETVARLEHAGVLRFVVTPQGKPGVFIAADREFATPADARIAHAIVEYFDFKGDYDTETGFQFERDGVLVTVAEWLSQSSFEIRRMSEEARMSVRNFHARLIDLEARGFLRVYRTPRSGKDWPSGFGFAAHFQVANATDLSRADLVVIRAVEAAADTYSRGRLTPDDLLRPTQRPGEHTYMRAIETQYAALAFIGELFHQSHAIGDAKVYAETGISPQSLWGYDVLGLKMAETFCWFQDPQRAVEAASVSLQPSVRMTRDLTNGHAGWWYFVEPLDVTTTDEGTPTQALLWQWTTRPKSSAVDFLGGDSGTESGVMISAYLMSKFNGVKGDNLIPSMRFFWPEGMSMRAMLAMNAREYEALAAQRNPSATSPTEQVTAAIDRFARFFAAGCLWIQDKILVYSKGHVERHERKRIEKAHKLDRPLSDVQIIALRRRQSVTISTGVGESGSRDWKCRWIVVGHWRNQYYPSLGRHQPKWIDSYPKGPDDKPLKVPQHRVYAVNR